MNFRLITAALALIPALSAPADENRVGLTVELVSEVTHVQPGTPFHVGVFIRHEPGFHTYWKQPGIVGVPTSIKWDLPRGWKGGDLEYPEPESVLMFTIKAQGYERDVLLQAQITPPKKLTPKTAVTLAGKAVWMCCAQSCHPGFKDLTITLPVASEAPPYDSKWHPVFEKERAAAPKESTAWTSAARIVSDTQIELLLTPVSDEARPLSEALAQKVIHFTEDGWIDSDDPRSITYDSATRRLRLLLPVSKGFRDKRPPKKLQSLLQLQDGWEKDGQPRTLRLSTPLTR